LVYALRPIAPDVSLGVVYVLAVIGVAVAFGVPCAIRAAIAIAARHGQARAASLCRSSVSSTRKHSRSMHWLKRPRVAAG
jgi:hypothetical protein